MKYLVALPLVLFPSLAFAALPAFDIRSVIWNVVVLLGVGAIFGLLNFLVDRAPFIGEPWKQYIKYFLILVAVLIIIYLILGLIGL